MKRLLLPVPLLAVALCGCIETKEEYTINPDGRGKVVFEATFQSMDMNLTNEERDPETQMRDAVQKELSESKGIDAWKDVTYKRTDDGRIQFKGTAYFADLARLRLRSGGFESKAWKPTLTKDSAGGLVLEFKSEKDAAKAAKAVATPAKLSDEEIKQRVTQSKAQYQQARAAIGPLMAGMKQEWAFRLPGTVAQSSNLKKEVSGAVRLTFQASKMLDVIDSYAKDDAWWQAQVQAGRNFAKDGPEMDLTMNEKLFGEKAPIRAVVSAPLKPLFDYDTEVAAAKKNFPAMVKTLKLGEGAAVSLAAPAKGEGFKSLKVGGVRIVYVSDNKSGVRPFSHEAGYTLSLVGELPGSVLSVPGGSVDKAIADNGDDLLPSSEWDRKIQFPNLSQDKTAVTFDVKLLLPGDGVQGLKEVSGKLQYFVSSATKQVDLGFTSLAVGSKGKEFDAAIGSIKESEWNKGKTDLELKLAVSKDAIKSVAFYGSDGNQVEAKPGGSMSMGDKNLTLTYTFSSTPPSSGKIILEMYDQMQKFEIPFTMSNISLSGRPMK